MKLSQKQAIILVASVVIVIVIVVVVILNVRPHGTAATVGKLAVWGIEDKKTFDPIIANYPYATVSYTQMDPANYDAQVLSALAAGTGPDVFEIGDHALPRWQSALSPLPASLASQYGALWISQTFPDVVTQDFVSGGKLYGLPLSIDTLALFYNKDLFNSAGIATPPKTWDDFEADVVRLRAVNAQGELSQAGAAIGGSEASIANAPDMLSLLMLQNGTQMMNSEGTAAAFAGGSGGSGLSAFNFYLQFANAASPYYTWNDSMGSDADSFAAGSAAMMFGYQSDLATIESKAPFLNVGIAPMPQPAGATIAVNYPSYEGFAAAKAGQTATAWNFILYLTASNANEKLYLTATGKPPANRTEIQADESNPQLSVFAGQALTAKSWPEPNDVQVSAIFNSAILNVLNGSDDSTAALNQAQSAVDALIQ